MARWLALKSVRRLYWELVSEGVPPWVAGARLGVSETTGGRWFRDAGGVKPQFKVPQGQKRPRLSHAERDEIMIGTSQGESIQSIARRLGRAPSTIMREIDRNGRCREATGRYRPRYRFGADRGGWDAKSGYRAHLAQARSEQRARRPKAGKLTRNPQLRKAVEELLVSKYSPEQIAGVLALIYPDRPEMQVSHETIYKTHYRSLFVQGRGELRRELAACLRTGRTVRKPRRRSGAPRGRIPGMVNIAERPAEAADRAVPGHWEGDLVRHEALCDRAEVKDLRRCAVAAA